MLLPIPPTIPYAYAIQTAVFGITVVLCIVLAVLVVIFELVDPPCGPDGKIRRGLIPLNIITVLTVVLAAYHLI
jgi:hypothetical protein